MVKSLKMTLVAAAALGGVALASGSASAMPLAPVGKAVATTVGAEKVAWVCGPFRCFWRPGFYGGYGWRGYGWRGYGWRGYGWGWRRRWW